MTPDPAQPAQSEPTYDLFPNGTSHMIWEGRNCDRCWKRPVKDQVGRNPKCCIETAIALASVTDGTLLHDGETSRKKAEAIAKRLEWDGHSYLTNDCPEREEKRPRYCREPAQQSVEALPLFTP